MVIDFEAVTEQGNLISLKKIIKANLLYSTFIQKMIQVDVQCQPKLNYIV